jgi:hypothetical protein
MEPVLNLDEATPSRIDMARALLQPKAPRATALPTLGAAALFAVGGLLLAYAVITAPMAEYQEKEGFEPVPEVKQAP